MKGKKQKVFNTVVICLAVALLAWQYEIFNVTIISVKTIAAIILVSGGLFCVVDFKKFQKVYDRDEGKFYLSAAFRYIGFGAVIYSLFILANFYLTEESIHTERYEIVGLGYTVNKHGRVSYSFKRPIFRINYNGSSKSIEFPEEYMDSADAYTHLQFEVQEGYFGYDILKNKMPVTERD